MIRTGELGASDEEVQAFACPKCIARYKKSQGSQDQLHGAPCQCGEHGSIAIFQEPDSESRVRVEANIYASEPQDLRPTPSPRCASPRIDGITLVNRCDWQSRACIWRI